MSKDPNSSNQGNIFQWKEASLPSHLHSGIFFFLLNQDSKIIWLEHIRQGHGAAGCASPYWTCFFCWACISLLGMLLLLGVLLPAGHASPSLGTWLSSPMTLSFHTQYSQLAAACQPRSEHMCRHLQNVDSFAVHWIWHPGSRSKGKNPSLPNSSSTVWVCNASGNRRRLCEPDQHTWASASGERTGPTATRPVCTPRIMSCPLSSFVPGKPHGSVT